MQTKVYTPQEFLKKLQHGDFKELSNKEFKESLIIAGMIKNVENNDNEFMFSIDTKIANWRKVPSSFIETITYLELISFEDNVYPLVEITFKEPQSKESKLLASFINDNAEYHKRVLIELTGINIENEMVKRSPCGQCFKKCGTDFFKCVEVCGPICPE